MNNTQSSNYILLRIKIILLLIIKRKINLRKILNAFNCYFLYFIKSLNSGKSPVVINIELWNECNESCKFCRTDTGDIYDQRNSGLNLEKGKLSLEKAIFSVDSIKNYLLMAIPYINGEPLISPILIDFLKFCDKNSLATMIATNGIKLDLNKSQQLLDSNLDVLKVHISGMSNDIHRIEHRTGDVIKILNNIKTFQILNKKCGNKTLVILDFIHYLHNSHELQQAKEFCAKHNLYINIRPGNTNFLDEVSLQKIKEIPMQRCDWVYSTMSVDWNGNLLPCCDFATWSKPYIYGNIINDVSTTPYEIWNDNNSLVSSIRSKHMQGRRSIDVCLKCPKSGIKFKF